MNGWLLDSNACIALLKRKEAVVQHVERMGVESLYLCAPVRAEQWFGACKSGRVAENQARLRRFFADLPCLPFDAAAAEQCGEIRAFLGKRGTPIGPYDTQIAAIALSHGFILVSHNLREFNRVPGLSVVDWEAGQS